MMQKAPVNSFPRQAAIFSLVAPAIAFGITLLLQPQFPDHRLVMIILGLTSVLLVFLGLAFGIAALASTRRHGLQGIFGKALAGTIINTLFVVLMIVSVVSVNKRLGRATQQQQQQSNQKASLADPLMFRLRLVDDNPGPDTEPLTIVRSLTDANGIRPETLHVRKEVLLDARAVRSASVETRARWPEIAILFTEEGRQRFADITRDNVGRRLAIVVDGKLLAAPRIMTEIRTGSALIEGKFSIEQAFELAGKINAAA